MGLPRLQMLVGIEMLVIVDLKDIFLHGLTDTILTILISMIK